MTLAGVAPYCSVIRNAFAIRNKQKTCLLSQDASEILIETRSFFLLLYVNEYLKTQTLDVIMKLFPTKWPGFDSRMGESLSFRSLVLLGNFVRKYTTHIND